MTESAFLPYRWVHQGNRLLQAGLLLNALCALGWIVLISRFERQTFGDAAFVLVMLTLGVFIAASAVRLTIPHGTERAGPLTFLVCGLLTLATGALIPTATAFGPALPASFITAGAMLLFALFMQRLMTSADKPRMSEAWRAMSIAIVLAPLTVAVGAAGLSLLGWPAITALPGGALGAFFLNPLVGYGLIIHTKPMSVGEGA